MLSGISEILTSSEREMIEAAFGAFSLDIYYCYWWRFTRLPG
jgi:hypothetical protein